MIPSTIRLRDANGIILPLPDAAVTVEICSSDGKIARLILPTETRIHYLTPEDPRLHKFCAAVGATPADVIGIT